jgi:DNA-binding HxlR family transcriptional regulator
MERPIARSLGCVGERWSFLILRDAFQGLTKFDEFRLVEQTSVPGWYVA